MTTSCHLQFDFGFLGWFIWVTDMIGAFQKVNAIKAILMTTMLNKKMTGGTPEVRSDKSLTLLTLNI